MYLLYSKQNQSWVLHYPHSYIIGFGKLQWQNPIYTVGLLPLKWFTGRAEKHANLSRHQNQSSILFDDVNE